MLRVVNDHIVCDDHVAALPYADACTLSARESELAAYLVLERNGHWQYMAYMSCTQS